MKPVMEKVAANLFDDKIKPFYDEEIKPYTGTLEAKGYAGSSALGGLIGYLASKYFGDDDSPVTNILSTIGGALAGAGIHTATQIMRERNRIKTNAMLPPGERLNPDGTRIVDNKPSKPGLVDSWTTAATLGGGVGGFKLGTLAYDTAAYNYAPRLGDQTLRSLKKTLKDAAAKMVENRVGDYMANPDYRAARTQYQTTKQAIDNINDRRKIFKVGPGNGRFGIKLNNKGRLFAGAGGAAAIAGLSYALTNPRARAAIAKKLDS